MARFFKKREQLLGTPPGSVVFVGNVKEEKVTINVIDYSKENIETHNDVNLGELDKFKGSSTSSWINIYGLHDTEKIIKIGEIFGVHTLTLEDIVNTAQRPKFEEFENYIFLALKMLNYNEEKKKIEAELLSIIIGDHFVISFQEKMGDVFEPVRERLRRMTSRIRTKGVDYLAYALLDAVVDKYVFIIEQFGEKIETLENEIIENPNENVLNEINENKREIAYLRKTIRPVRDLVFQLHKSESNIVHSKVSHYIEDLLDLTTHCTEVIEIYREMLSDLLNFYHTNMTNRLNDIMKTLTIFSVVFIPLTFIAGIYGTNFEYFPELGFRYAYPLFWLALLVVGITMLVYFRRRKWF